MSHSKSTLELLLEFLEFLLSSHGALFPTLPTEAQIAAVDLLLAILTLPGGGLGLPLVAAADEFGNEDSRWCAEVTGGGRLGWTVHLLILRVVHRNRFRYEIHSLLVPVSRPTSARVRAWVCHVLSQIVDRGLLRRGHRGRHVHMGLL